ncbi:MAG: amidase family protein [Micropepsaceae bacterium]
MNARDLPDLDTASATTTARAIKSGIISALEACDAAIARIERLDGPINAVVVRDFDRARATAKAIDANRARDDQRPLLGVPMTVKESNDVAGLPTTWGLVSFKDVAVKQDSVPVARLKSAGAVVLGKTNAPVALADWQAVNPIYGRTVNPHDHKRTPGGSSGGAAAALASGMIPLELGSDIGGSIRVPAHMCGVFGHKPTYGIVPLKGHGFPGTDTIDVPLAVVGPLARSVEDLTVALDVVAGPVESVAYQLELPPARHAALKDYRVLVVDTHPSAATDSTVRAPLDTLAKALARSGAKVMHSANGFPDLAAAHRAYGAMLTAVTTRGVPGATVMDAHAWMELQDEQMRLARQWHALFADIDVVLTPPFGVPAFPHDDSPNWAERTLVVDGEATPYGNQVAWPGVATFPGLPATAAPIGKTQQGLTVGVQILGDMFGDRTTLAFANLLKREGLAG